MPVIFDKRVKVVKAPDAQKNVLYTIENNIKFGMKNCLRLMKNTAIS